MGGPVRAQIVRVPAGPASLDAVEAIYWTLNGKHTKRQWILDADLKAAFDKIGHAHLLALLEGFPARDLIRQWLKAGVVSRTGSPRPRRELHKGV